MEKFIQNSRFENLLSIFTLFFLCTVTILLSIQSKIFSLQIIFVLHEIELGRSDALFIDSRERLVFDFGSVAPGEIFSKKAVNVIQRPI